MICSVAIGIAIGLQLVGPNSSPVLGMMIKVYSLRSHHVDCTRQSVLATPKKKKGEAKLQFFNGERLDHGMGTGPASEFPHPIFTAKSIGQETRKCCR